MLLLLDTFQFFGTSISKAFWLLDAKSSFWKKRQHFLYGKVVLVSDTYSILDFGGATMWQVENKFLLRYLSDYGYFSKYPVDGNFVFPWNSQKGARFMFLSRYPIFVSMSKKYKFINYFQHDNSNVSYNFSCYASDVLFRPLKWFTYRKRLWLGFAGVKLLRR